MTAIAKGARALPGARERAPIDKVERAVAACALAVAPRTAGSDSAAV